MRDFEIASIRTPAAMRPITGSSTAETEISMAPRGRAQGVRGAAFDHAGLEAGALCSAVSGRRTISSGAGAMREAADEPRSSRASHEAMYSRFRAQIQRQLHFVERGGHPVGAMRA